MLAEVKLPAIVLPELPSDGFVKQRRELQDHLKSHILPQLIDAHPYMHVLLTHEKKVYLSDTFQHACDLLKRLKLEEQPYAIRQLIPPSQKKLIATVSITARTNDYWYIPIKLHHDSTGYLSQEPFEALLDTGCETGVSNIPPEQVATLMRAKVPVLDITSSSQVQWPTGLRLRCRKSQSKLSLMA
jgi:hypothetical protein